MKFSLLLAATDAVLVSTGMAQVAGRSCNASHFKVVALPLRPARINNSGMIAGATEDHQLATWTEKDGLRTLELPSGFTTAEALGVSQSGDIAASTAREGSDEPFAFVYSHGKFVQLAEEHSKAMATNDSGDVVGQVGNGVVLWRKQKATPLGGCCGGMPHGMNNHGQIVGQINDKGGHYSAFLWDSAHGLRSIAPPHAATSNALAINESGHVLVQSFTPNAAFVLRDGKFTAVHMSTEFASQPLGLNKCDVVVGEFGAASDFNRAFIWDEKNGFRDLNKLADVGTEWILESAFDINDRGEIIGIGDRGSEQEVGFLLVPEPKITNHKGHEVARR